MTCLFCDLVGFTARAERMDPEDVRRLLQPYHASVRAELERFGGTVEKFIGDAVMAVFGAPVAHEDDPERAVRAALSIRELLAEEGELEVRIGITTGEALVALGARPDAGEGMAAGDVVNTAARLQAAAPDERRPRGRDHVPGDRAGDRVRGGAAGRGEGQVRASAGLGGAPADGSRRRRAVGGAPLVGREHELTLLRETLGACRPREGAPAGHARRRSRDRQEPTRLRALSDDRDRATTASSTGATGARSRTGRRHVLGARRDREGAGRDPRERRPAQADEKLRQAIGRFVDDPGTRPGSRATCAARGLETDEARAG